MKANEREDYHKDAASLKFDRVQLWTENGTMATGEYPVERARELIDNGRAFVISDQAIGICDG